MDQTLLTLFKQQDADFRELMYRIGQEAFASGLPLSQSWYMCMSLLHCVEPGHDVIQVEVAVRQWERGWTDASVQTDMPDNGWQ